MAGYQPPFTITNRMVGLVSEIAEKIGRLDRNKSLDMKPHLRRNNRIRSIHSSLAIEANSLSIDAVRGVIDGKTVFGPEKEIQEVKNAYNAYDALGKFDPFSIDELKRLHGIMTYLTVNESGQFRHGENILYEGDFPLGEEHQAVWHSIKPRAYKLGRETAHDSDGLHQLGFNGFLPHIGLLCSGNRKIPLRAYMRVSRADDLYFLHLSIYKKC